MTGSGRTLRGRRLLLGLSGLQGGWSSRAPTRLPKWHRRMRVRVLVACEAFLEPMAKKHDALHVPQIRRHQQTEESDANDKGLWFEFILLFFLLSSALTQKGWTPVRRSNSKSETLFFQKRERRARFQTLDHKNILRAIIFSS